MHVEVVVQWLVGISLVAVVPEGTLCARLGEES